MERPEETPDADRPSSDLIKELRQRYRQLGSIPNAYRPKTPSDIAPEGGPAPGQRVQAASSRAQVEQRIHHIEAILKGRGHL
jgi:hypothetical protein